MKEFIKKDDLVFDVVAKHPELKKVLQEASPKFKKLDNPLAFNTLARVTTLERAAKIGGIYLRELLYRLNDALGLGADYLLSEKAAISAALKNGDDLRKIATLASRGKEAEDGAAPEWLPVAETFPVMDLRRESADPFEKVMKLADGTRSGGGCVLIQNFEPTPLILHLRKLGFEDWVRRVRADEYRIYLYKK